MSWTVYAHTNKVNGKSYVGITSREVEKRWGVGGNQYKPDRTQNQNRKFWNAIKKYGWDNFEHEVLMDNLTEEQAKEYEKLYILHYDSYKNGYNSTCGGEGAIGLKHSKKTRKQMSSKRKGVRHTSEWSRHISDGQRMKRKVVCLETGVTYETPHECANDMNLHEPSLLAVCRGANLTVGGYHFQYADEKRKTIEEIELNRNNRHRSKPVFCIETNLQYSSVRDCAKQTGYGVCTIERSCKNHTSTHGFHFVYCCDNVTIEQICKAEVERKQRDSRYRKVRCIEDDLIFDSIKDCARYYNCSLGNISSVCAKRKNFKTVKNKHFEYYEK